jgi:serpin B
VELVARVASADPRPNVVLSPLSASMALGMTLNGANAATFDSMRATLGFGDLTQDEINASYRGLIDLLSDLDPTVRFEIANAVWAREGFPFHQTFFDAVAGAVDAAAGSRDFTDPATVDEINAWVAGQTDGLIDRIVEELDSALVMLLVNAIYFDGAWTLQFDPKETRVQHFTLEDGSSAAVPMMRMRDVEVRRGYGADYAAVELPYGGGAYSMVVVLPYMGARAWLAAMDAARWATLVESIAPGELDLVSLPKLTLTYDAYLNDALRGMGMDLAFRGQVADFTRMSPRGNELCIDFVRQKTFIEIDERGTRAAAVTAVGVALESSTEFVADRPFVFAIRERLTGTVVFVGLVGDPTAEDPGAAPPSRDDC